MSTHNIFYSTLAGILFLSACSTDHFIQTEGNMPSKSNILAVKQGMSKDDVLRLMGSPSIISSLDHRTWIYMNSTMKKVAFFKPEEVDRNIVAIEFNLDGEVVKLVQLTKENGKDIIISKDATPVMGTEQTFMEKYFGGVGYMPVQPTKDSNGL